VNYYGAKAFEDKFDGESLLRLAHLAKWRRVTSRDHNHFFTVLYGILSKIIDRKNDQVFISFQIIRVTLGWLVGSPRSYSIERYLMRLRLFLHARLHNSLNPKGENYPD
jgi:hypothetical protein